MPWYAHYPSYMAWLVRCAGEYIAKDDYTNVLWKSYWREPKIEETLDTPCIWNNSNSDGNSAKIIVPRSTFGTTGLGFIFMDAGRKYGLATKILAYWLWDDMVETWSMCKRCGKRFTRSEDGLCRPCFNQVYALGGEETWSCTKYNT